MKRLIGLSLSMCVADIASGKVSESDVTKIVASTRFATPEDFEDVLSTYSKLYWKRYPEAAGIARRLHELGLIDQPRLRGERSNTATHDYWRLEDGD